MTGLFTFGAPGHRTVAQWRSDPTLTAPTWRGKARQYAKRHRHARALLADGTMQVWYVDDSTTPAKIRTKHYRQVCVERSDA